MTANNLSSKFSSFFGFKRIRIINHESLDASQTEIEMREILLFKECLDADMKI